MWPINKWDSQTTDAKKSFLYAELEEEIFMKIPEGITGELE